MKRSGTTDRRLALLLVCLLLPAGGSAAPVHADGVLWEVQGPGETQPSHVFGTIHSDDPRVLDLDPAIERAFRSSRQYAFELDFDADIRQTMAQAMFDRAPPTLEEQLGDDDWRRARSAAQARGVPVNALQSMEPWALAITISLPPMDPAATLDRVLFQRASDLGRPVHGLETAKEQLSLFDDLPEHDQLDLLRATLDLAEQEALAPMFESLTAAWLRGDLAALMEISESNPMLPDGERNDAFTKKVVDERNERMVERMQPLIERGGAFVAVGALHLPGERGVLRLLEEAGYTVTPVD
ncbi:MAG: TraB/GumN family protein [Halofilum sp. (in: g-proteobacteria)]|nr:TraB/GumN family protein [Halofilum sp. (in: g-proteobacteria)]